ncbi:response regulator [Bizionia sp. KMM 8389]
MNTTINTVCIIDDDPIYVFGTKKIMESLNFCKNFLVYKNGKKALDYLIPKLETNATLPDLILLDLNMPILDGWQVLDEIIKIQTKRKIKIYIVSSSIDSRDLQRAKEYDLVSNYIIKPFSAEKLNELCKDIQK